MVSANDFEGGEGVFPLGKDFAQAYLGPHGTSSCCKAAGIERVRGGEVGG